MSESITSLTSSEQGPLVEKEKKSQGINIARTGMAPWGSINY